MIKKYGNVEEKEMLRTFNLGVGLTIVAKKKNAEKIINHIKEQGVNCYEIGEIVSGNKQVEVIGEFNW